MGVVALGASMWLRVVGRGERGGACPLWARWWDCCVLCPSLSLRPCLPGATIPYSDHEAGREVEPGNRWPWVGVGGRQMWS